MPENVPQPQPPTPPSAAPQPPQAPQPGAPNPYGQPKKNTGLIIGIVIGIIVLLGGGVALAITLSNSGNKDDDSSKQENKNDDNTEDANKEDEATDEDKLRAANAKTASSMTDMKTVCEVGSVTNAAELKKPYQVSAFAKEDNARDYWSQVSLKYDAPYTVKYDEYEKVNVVVCLTENSDARVKAKTCDFKSGDDKLKIDYYATSYDAVAYEAKSGKKLEDLGKISAPASSCPYFATYDKSDPKIIAKPDSAAVDAAVAKFAK